MIRIVFLTVAALGIAQAIADEQKSNVAAPGAVTAAVSPAQLWKSEKNGKVLQCSDKSEKSGCCIQNDCSDKQFCDARDCVCKRKPYM